MLAPDRLLVHFTAANLPHATPFRFTLIEVGK
jgi:hypothetical protein